MKFSPLRYQSIVFPRTSAMPCHATVTVICVAKDAVYHSSDFVVWMKVTKMIKVI